MTSLKSNKQWNLSQGGHYSKNMRKRYNVEDMNSGLHWLCIEEVTRMYRVAAICKMNSRVDTKILPRMETLNQHPLWHLFCSRIWTPTRTLYNFFHAHRYFRPQKFVQNAENSN